MFGLKREKLDMVVPARLSWLQLIVLWLVIISFVMFGFVAWGMGRGSAGGGRGPAGVAIRVAGQEITLNAFLRQLREVDSTYRQRFQGQDEDFFKRLNVPRQVADSLVTKEIALLQARKLGLGVTDTEVREYIMNAFVNKDGVFLGSEAVDRYQSSLGLSDDQFRAYLASDILFSKFRDLLQAAVVVTDDEVSSEYLRINDRASAEYVWLNAASLSTDIELSDDEVQGYYSGHGAEFEVEERQPRYVVFDADDYAADAAATDEEIAAAFERRSSRGDFDEKRRARHILLRTSSVDPAELAAVEQRARELAEQARSGADFANLATTNSDDTASAERGGDLGLFGRGAMVPAFENAAFGLQPGGISDPVKTNYGYHVIKLEEIQPPRTLAQATPELQAEVSRENSLRLAREAAEAAISAATESGDIDQLASASGKTVLELDFFAAEIPPQQIEGIDAPYRSSFARALFSIEEEGRLSSSPLIAGRKIVVMQFAGERGPVIPPLDAIRSKVEQAARLDRGRGLAREKSSLIEAAVAGGSLLADAATEAEAELKTAGPFARDGAFPGVPGSEKALTQAYASEVGSIAAPVELDQGILWYRLTERFEFEQTKFDSEKRAIRDRLVSSRATKDADALLQSVRLDLEGRNEIEYLTPELFGDAPGLLF